MLSESRSVDFVSKLALKDIKASDTMRDSLAKGNMSASGDGLNCPTVLDDDVAVVCWGISSLLDMSLPTIRST